MLCTAPPEVPRGLPLCALQRRAGIDTLTVPQLLSLDTLLRLVSAPPPAPARRFAVPRIVDAHTYARLAAAGAAHLAERAPPAEWNPPRSLADLYTPRRVRRAPGGRAGLCPVCYERGIARFYGLRRSSYSTHMRHQHGVSACTGDPLPTPSAYVEGAGVLFGRCPLCRTLVRINSTRATAGAPLAGHRAWWDHAQRCERTHARAPAPPRAALRAWFAGALADACVFHVLT